VEGEVMENLHFQLRQFFVYERAMPRDARLEALETFLVFESRVWDPDGGTCKSFRRPHPGYPHGSKANGYLRRALPQSYLLSFLKKFEMATDWYSIMRWNWLKGRKIWGRAMSLFCRASWDIHLKK
jgi:hypothetical protein